MDELVAKFLPRFAVLARDRIEGALRAAEGRRHDRAEAVAHDMHSLAGEAGLLGLEGVIVVARAAEDAARRFGGSGGDADAAAFVDCLRSLERAVAAATNGVTDGTNGVVDA
ncbi:MAG TPA: Hpt domain-containing protein [Polyangiaceae bacterium]|jgi:HPt (histidine-containing phosphotransfer) domain-containing protein